jgi:hypothetical protein
MRKLTCARKFDRLSRIRGLYSGSTKTAAQLGLAMGTALTRQAKQATAIISKRAICAHARASIIARYVQIFTVHTRIFIVVVIFVMCTHSITRSRDPIEVEMITNSFKVVENDGDDTIPPEVVVKKILKSMRIYEVAKETPISPAPILSKKINNTVIVKREDLQPIYSFKLRGAFNKVSALTEEERKRGIICASAGNHAQVRRIVWQSHQHSLFVFDSSSHCCLSLGCGIFCAEARHSSNDRDANGNAFDQSRCCAIARRKCGAQRRQL